MFGFTTPTGREGAGPLTNVAAVDEFWRSLPRFDPVPAQKSVCAALADFGVGYEPQVDQLRALLVLDRRARSLDEALLVNYMGQDAYARSAERRYWQSAFDLSQGFGRAYGHVLRYIQEDALNRGWREYTPVLLLRLFQHRQSQCLLRPFDRGQGNPTDWSELHQAYQYAHSQRLLTQVQSTKRSHDERAVDSTIEREYVHVLLLDFMNRGHFSPYDAFWVNRWIPESSEALSLKSVRSASAVGADQFAVDLDSDEGLVRVPAPTAVRCVVLDPAPLIARIDSEIAALRDPANRRASTSSYGRGRQLKVLRKLAVVFSPKPVRVARRGERKPVALVMQGIVGLTNILRMLRNERRRAALTDPSIVPEVEEITIPDVNAFPDTVSTQLPGSGGRSRAGGVETPVPQVMWEMMDRSDSGCRLQAQVQDMNGVTPGVLVAIREHEMAAWTVVVIRRVGKTVGNRVDVGVEYVGRTPRRVIVTMMDGDATEPGAPPTEGVRRFAAIHLPESFRQPALPFKTLLMPAGLVRDGDRLAVRSGTTRYRIRLKEPIEEQGDFIWLPYEVTDREFADSAPATDSSLAA